MSGYDVTRFCKKCSMRTAHELLETTRADRNPRGGGVYRCRKCGTTEWKRHLRPSSEISY